MVSIAERIQTVSIQFVPFIMAVVVREVARGWVAHCFGDSSPKSQGRLTFNPLPHLEIFGTIIFPLSSMLMGSNLLFGWARPMPIQPTRFKGYKSGLFWVSAAGPLGNFILAILSAVVFFSIKSFASPSFYLFEPLLGMSFVSISLNYSIGIFNLLPIPPLDGSRLLEVFLPPKMTPFFLILAQNSFFILLILLATGALSYLAYPIQFCTQITLGVVGLLFHS